MPYHAPLSKVQATRNYGAEVELVKDSFDDAAAYAAKLSKEEGFTFIAPFDDEKVIAGQGTIGLEILEKLPDTDIIVVPIGGGGLISGVATAVKGLAPQVKTIGVEPAGADRYARSRAAGQPVTLDKVDTIADGTRTDHATLFNFEMIQDKVDELCTADDDHIRQAMVLLMTKAKLMVEPSGALPVAAALAGRLPVEKGQKVAFVLSGGNVDPALAARLLADVQA